MFFYMYVFLVNHFKPIFLIGSDIITCIIGNCSSMNEVNFYNLSTFSYLHKGEHNWFQDAVSIGFTFSKKRYQTTINIRAGHIWKPLDFNKMYGWHFTFINTVNNRMSNGNACSLCLVLLDSILAIFFFDFLLLFFWRYLFLFFHFTNFV